MRFYGEPNQWGFTECKPAQNGWPFGAGGEKKKKKTKISRFLSFRNAALDCMFSLFLFLHAFLKKKGTYLLKKKKLNVWHLLK